MNQNSLFKLLNCLSRVQLECLLFGLKNILLFKLYCSNWWFLFLTHLWWGCSLTLLIGWFFFHVERKSLVVFWLLVLVKSQHCFLVDKTQKLRLYLVSSFALFCNWWDVIAILVGEHDRIWIDVDTLCNTGIF